MAGPPLPCVWGGAIPPDATGANITWYRNWPITYPLDVSTLGLPHTLQEIHNASGTVIGIQFHDAAGKPIAGLDSCGNPLPPPGGGGGGGGGGVPLCPEGFVWDTVSETCIPIPAVIIPPFVGGGGSGGLVSVGNPPPPEPPTPACPGGFHWDAQRERCVQDNPGKIIIPGGQGDGDEFTDCCEETLAALAIINDSIKALHGVTVEGGDGTAACCAQVVKAIGLVASSLTALTHVIIEKNFAGGAALDLAPVADAIASLNTSFDTLINGNGGNTLRLVAALDGIKDAFVGPPRTFRPLPPDVDVDALIRYLEDNYALDSGAAQLLTAKVALTP